MPMPPLIGEPFEIEDISRRLAFFRDPWGNMIELSQKLPGTGS
ncbi:VOC family protein [Streptomyces sp. NPDC127097]